MKLGMEPFLVLNRTISSKSVVADYFYHLFVVELFVILFPSFVQSTHSWAKKKKWAKAKMPK